MDLGLRDRVALVTGSSQGIGRATAELLAREGAKVGITYRQNRDKAEAAAETIRRAGGEALVVAFDLASEASIRAAVGAVIDRWGHIDVLVNNAVEWGVRKAGQFPRFDEVPGDEWRTWFRSNSEGHFIAIQAVLPSMRARRWGRIVNISSGLALTGIPGAGYYASAKAALHGLTRTLFRELGREGILTNTVMAGATNTDHMRTQVPEEIRAHIAQASPIGRMGDPEEVARTIAFVASAANTMLNGEILLASGGHM